MSYFALNIPYEDRTKWYRSRDPSPATPGTLPITYSAYSISRIFARLHRCWRQNMLVTRWRCWWQVTSLTSRVRHHPQISVTILAYYDVGDWCKSLRRDESPKPSILYPEVFLLSSVLIIQLKKCLSRKCCKCRSAFCRFTCTATRCTITALPLSNGKTIKSQKTT